MPCCVSPFSKIPIQVDTLSGGKAQRARSKDGREIRSALFISLAKGRVNIADRPERSPCGTAGAGIPDHKHPGSERIKAFIKPREEFKGKLNADDIIAYCKEKLPAIAVPKYVEFRDEMPLTVTEKIFKRALREEEIKKMKEQGVLK